MLLLMWLILSLPKALFIYFGLCAQKQTLAFGADLDAQALSKDVPYGSALAKQLPVYFPHEPEKQNLVPGSSEQICVCVCVCFQHNMG